MNGDVEMTLGGGVLNIPWKLVDEMGAEAFGEFLRHARGRELHFTHDLSDCPFDQTLYRLAFSRSDFEDSVSEVVDHSDPNHDIVYEIYEGPVPPPNSNDVSVKDLQAETKANSDRWFPSLAKTSAIFQLMYHGLGLTGEAGEVADNIKKLARIYVRKSDVDAMYDPEADRLRDEIRTELADVWAYLSNIAAILGVSIDEAYRAKASYNETRDWSGGAG